MLDFILKRVAKLSGTYSILFGLVFGLLWGIGYFEGFVGPKIGGIKPLDAEVYGYNVSVVQDKMNQYGEHGRRIYYTFVSGSDLMFCLFYSTFLSAWLIRLYGYRRSSSIGTFIVQIIDIIPYIGGLSDFVENWYFLALTYTYPLLLTKDYLWLVPIASTISRVKWAGFFASVALVFVGIVKSLIFGSVKTKSKAQ